MRLGFGWGFIAGIGAVYLYHRFVSPLPGGKRG
jgi:hypothetical protein